MVIDGTKMIAFVPLSARDVWKNSEPISAVPEKSDCASTQAAGGRSRPAQPDAGFTAETPAGRPPGAKG